MSTSVGIVGATGAVGQRFVQLIDDHAGFEVETVAASPDSVGKSYRQAAKWRLDTPIPDDVASLTVRESEPQALPDDLDLIFSSLPSSVAEAIEPELCEAGYVVSSNSSNERLAEDVPLLIPEVNAEHIDLLAVQRDRRGWDGALIKNPNCSTITMVPTLAPLTEFGLESVHVATLQAVSGAGYSGVTSMEILDNVLPHIGGEEKKMETETRKLLGAFDGSAVDWHDVSVSASCNRVATLDGHLENVWTQLADPVSVETAAEAFENVNSSTLPSSPEELISVFEDPNRPQPRLDRMAAGGMGIAVGGIQSTDIGLQYNCLAHNTIRGAAGASLLNGELLVQEDWV